MKMDYTVFLCVSVFLAIQVTPIIANSPDTKRQSDIEDVRERLKGYLQKTNEKFDLSEEERKLSRMIWDARISDKKVYGKLMSYIRQQYANNLDKHMNGLRSGLYQQHEITSRKGINT
jgi:cell shape-determining protein MreC